MRHVYTRYGWALLFGISTLGTACAPHPDERAEEAGEAAQALDAPTCVTLRRGGTGDVHDAFLSGDHPTWATGDDWGMWTGLSSGGNTNHALIKPDLSPIPQGSTVVSATLRVRQSWSDANNLVFVHPVNAPWSEATVSLATFDPAGIDPTPIASFAGGGSGVREIDVTGLVAGWVSGAAPNNGVALVEPSVQRHYFFTSEVSTESSRPSLEVCYLADEPEPAFDDTGCGPDVHFTDPEKFAAIPGSDFQEPEIAHTGAAATQASPWVHEGIAYYNDLYIHNGWCIPGMDSGSCSGTNYYMIFDGTRYIDPLADTKAIAFRWGTQGPSVTINVELTDGTSRSFFLNTPAPGGWGSTGFFGYCTGSSPVSVARVSISGPDGGIDDVRCLGCQ